MGFAAYRQSRWTDEERNMTLNTLRAAAVVLSGTLTVVSASAATRNQRKPIPEKPTISGCLLGHVCADDVLLISVDGKPAVSGRYRVGPSGEIVCPYVGRLTVSGLKPAAVAKLITDGFRKAGATVPTVSVEIEAEQKAAK